MFKPSEYLKSKGWRPARLGVHPQETHWIDPLEGRMITLIEAWMTQFQRDKAKKEQSNVAK